MKMSKILSLLLVVVMLVMSMTACFTTPNTPNTPDTPDTPDTPPVEVPTELTDEMVAQLAAEYAGEYNIKMWVSEIAGVAELTQAQIDAFEEKYPGIVITAEIEGVTEADAATKVVADVASAPDIYCFAQDQLARLVQASALAQPVEVIKNILGNCHDAGSVAAASVAGTMWAYPLTADNGFYMFYDKSLISEEDAESMEKLIEICNANDRTFRYPLSNGWYNAGFFFATGCHSAWTTDANGKFTSIDDTYNSEAGLVAMKGMQKLAQAKCFNADNEKGLTDAAVVITGTWAVKDMKELFGNNYAATDLPSFTVDGKSYHIGSFTGNKLMGVKPQTDAKRTVVLSLLAEFLTNDECQLERFAAYGWGPSNLKAQQSEAVQSDPALAAFAKQSAYGKPQGNINGSWWDIAALLGDKAKAATSDADLQKALTEYRTSIDAVLNKSDDELAAWSIIGAVNGTMWDTDLPMTQVSDGVWESGVYTFNAGEEFKLRQGGGWNCQVGVANEKTGETTSGYYARLADGADEPGNITVETTGSYKIRLTWEAGTHNATVEFVPAE